ncbi:hypothetical protein [Marinobacter sp. AC-23]|uniref:hypothetical protein n=1 Tax=Marinobacter sp. AC-23 TaxID=1879031 RepID=UPI000B0E4F30|nr:hypothetical protein [Marinobacter sp. AC-23]
MTELNELGAEWQTGVQLGTEPRVRTQWYQPLDYGYERFLVAGAQYSQDTFSLYDTEGERVAELDVTFRQVDLGLGMELGGNAEVRFEYVRGYATVDQQLGAAAVPEDAVHQATSICNWCTTPWMMRSSPAAEHLPESGGVSSEKTWVLTGISIR